jgi:hypothetical protein
MRIEDKLGDAMRRAVVDEPLPRDVWESFQRRAERSRRARMVAGVVASLAVIAVAVVAVPRITSGDRRVGVAGSPSPSASVSSSPQPAYKVHTSSEQAWAFQAPPDWRAGTFEGEYEVNLPGLPGMTVGEDTYALAVMLRNERFDASPDAGMRWEGPLANPELFGDRAYMEYMRVEANGGVYHVYRVDWSGPNVYCAPDTRCATATLQVTVLASTKELLGKYATIGQRFLESITHL